MRMKAFTHNSYKRHTRATALESPPIIAFCLLCGSPVLVFLVVVFIGVVDPVRHGGREGVEGLGGRGGAKRGSHTVQVRFKSSLGADWPVQCCQSPCYRTHRLPLIDRVIDKLIGGSFFPFCYEEKYNGLLLID